jgi:hypothetical protein
VGGRVGRRFVAVAIALQVAIPTVALLEGPPSRFGFHMYSGQSALEVTVVDADGRTIPVDLDQWVARGRSELDWTDALPPRICAELPEAAEVTVRSGDRVRRLTCSR